MTYRYPAMMHRPHTPTHLAILGGGPAGLTAGYYAEKNHIPFTIYEAGLRVGGNSVTIRHGDFLFDSGAHLLSAKDADVASEIGELLKGDLNIITLPLQTYYNGRLVDFPFSLLNLLKTMGRNTFAKAAFEIAAQKFARGQRDQNFESATIGAYGKTIATRLILNYSEKLWGRPCSELSPRVAGELLRGFDFGSLLIEAICGRTARIEHLAGLMYYPRKGFGVIAEKLSQFCGRNRICTGSEITRILHNHERIQSIEVNHDKKTRVDEVLSTLPLNVFIQRMDPTPPTEILSLANSLNFRSLVLVTLFLRRTSVTQSASVHFPDPQFKVGRIHEPRNRSENMAPHGATSLVAEIPCQQNDESWRLEDQKLIQLVQSELTRIGWIKDEEVSDGLVLRLNHAYPVLDIGYERKTAKIFAYLNGFCNLKYTGRNGAFRYVSFHHIMKTSKKVVNEYFSPATESQSNCKFF